MFSYILLSEETLCTGCTGTVHASFEILFITRHRRSKTTVYFSSYVSGFHKKIYNSGFKEHIFSSNLAYVCVAQYRLIIKKNIYSFHIGS